jgi:hypothetical protein
MLLADAAAAAAAAAQSTAAVQMRLQRMNALQMHLITSSCQEI